MAPIRSFTTIALLAVSIASAAVPHQATQSERALKGRARSHPHCPLASFKRPERPLQHIKNLASGVKQRVARLLTRIEERHRGRNYALDVFEAEMALRQQILRQLQAQEESAAAAKETACSSSSSSTASSNSKPSAAQQKAAAGGSVGSTGSSVSSSGKVARELVEPMVVFVTDSLEAATHHHGQQQQGQPGGGSKGLARRYLTYGHWMADVLAFAMKAVAVVLFQVMGAAMAVHEYQRTGVVSSTLLRFSGLLFGLALVPPVAVALREAVPSHTRNPLVRGVCRLLELGLDVLVVSALSLAMSLILAAVFSLPAYNVLLSHKLTEDYIRGSVAAGLVYFLIWAFARNFEPLATKWFI